MNEYCTKISSFDGLGSMDVILKRPSVLSLAMKGIIPNPLLSAAARLFDFAPKSQQASLKEIGEILHIIAEASLISPSYEDIKDSLTDTQLMEIYHYAKEGADGLECFRMLGELHSGNHGGKGEQHGGEQNDEN